MSTYVKWMLEFMEKACQPSSDPVCLAEEFAYTHARSAAAAALVILAEKERMTRASCD
jgi:hypothetical protein